MSVPFQNEVFLVVIPLKGLPEHIIIYDVDQDGWQIEDMVYKPAIGKLGSSEAEAVIQYSGK